jgi:uncharacterized membrane protein (UPF0127 family)
MEPTKVADPEKQAQETTNSVKQDTRMRILNVTRNTEVATSAEVASNGAKRAKGLLGRKGLERGEGMWIVPCEAVHTFFMQFPLDLIYLDRRNRVRKVKSHVVPWRLSLCLSAHSILELPLGTIRDSQTQVGDLVEIFPADTISSATI